MGRASAWAPELSPQARRTLWASTWPFKKIHSWDSRSPCWLAGNGESLCVTFSRHETLIVRLIPTDSTIALINWSKRQNLNACASAITVFYSPYIPAFRECREALLRRSSRVLLDKGNILFIEIILALNILCGLFVKLPARAWILKAYSIR
jgi:hypothetical protein